MPSPELTVADAHASEDAGVMVFTVKLSVSSGMPVTVDYATSDGTRDSRLGLYGG